MDLKELGKKINELINPELKLELKKAIEETKLAEDAPAETPAETTSPEGEVLNEAKLKDGTVIKFLGDLAVGTEIIVVTPDGEVPAPEGEHELETGEVLVVAKEGDKSVVAEIKVANEEAPAETAMSADDKKELEAKIQELADLYESKFSSLKAENEKLALKLSKVNASVHTVAVTLSEVVNMPTTDAIEKPENTEVKLSKKEKAFQRLIGK